MMNNPQVIVALNNISKISDGKRILTNLDLEIYDGEFLTLLRLLARQRHGAARGIPRHLRVRFTHNGFRNTAIALILGRLTLALPAAMAGWLLSFTLSLDDVVVSAFVSGPAYEILPLKIYSTPVKDAIPLLTPAFRNNPMVFPSDEIKRKGEFQSDVGDASRLYEQYFLQLKAMVAKAG